MQKSRSDADFETPSIFFSIEKSSRDEIPIFSIEKSPSNQTPNFSVEKSHPDQNPIFFYMRTNFFLYIKKSS